MSVTASASPRGETEKAGGKTIREMLEEQGRVARAAARKVALLSTDQKNKALHTMAQALRDQQEDILAANAVDVAGARERDVPSALIDRLTLNPDRIEAMAEGLEAVAALPDPVGRGVGQWRLANGMEVQQVRVPLGVVGMIYEARPNVTADAAGLCLKAGNAVILRGSGEALNSNRAICQAIAKAAEEAGVPHGAIQLVDDVSRESALELMRLDKYLDVLIPRGGAGLIRAAVENATVPVLETGVGNCHIYVDESAEPDKATAIVLNAKLQRPGVCNAVETLLVHESLAGSWLPEVAAKLAEQGVELRGCQRAREAVPTMLPASEDDWHREYLDLILAVRVVDSLDAAVDHINAYGTGHSEAIVTSDYRRARRFVDAVDAAVVYANASTRFTDGFQFGLGAEIGISTQKLHARGPMGLEALTSTKYVVLGDGHVRP